MIKSNRSENVSSDSNDLENRRDIIRTRLLQYPSIRHFKNSIKRIKDEHLLMKILVKVEEVLNDYTCGDKKRGDLAGIRAAEITYKGIYYRLAYIAYSDDDSTEINILFIYFGSRENYYSKKLKKIFKGNTSLNKLRRESK